MLAWEVLLRSLDSRILRADDEFIFYIPLVYALPRSPTGLALPAGAAGLRPRGRALFFPDGRRKLAGAGRYFILKGGLLPDRGGRPPSSRKEAPRGFRGTAHPPPI